MRIVVLNGSPKGHQSVTMQYVHYIEKRFPRHHFTYIDISEKIQRLEKNDLAFQEVIDTIKDADGILWAFPLYYFLIPSQYKRFIELIRERRAEDAFRDKYTAVLSTSLHVHDMMAHHYMNAICDDLHMKFTGFFSASMYDLLKKDQRKQLYLFAKYFLFTIRKQAPAPRNYLPVTEPAFEYTPALVKDLLSPHGKKVLIVTDAAPKQKNLNWMITRLQDSFFGYTETVNLHNVDIKGGCLGCLQCAYNNICVYQDKDGYTDFFNSKVRAADILIFAGAISDRHFSSTWKSFYDRSFFNNHIPTMTGKQIGFLVSGPLNQLPDLRQFMEAFTEIQQGNLGGIVSDDCGNSNELDGLITLMADRLVRYSVQGFRKPKTYFEVGVRKIFRDEIWKSMRFPFQADHKYYEQEGLYDFPERKFRHHVKTNLMVMITKIPFVRREIYTKQMKPGTIRPLEDIVAAAGPDKA